MMNNANAMKQTLEAICFFFLNIEWNFSDQEISSGKVERTGSNFDGTPKTGGGTATHLLIGY
jgi:hypothetical protein